MKPILYISHSKRGPFYYNDASARYRCVFPAEELIANGQQAHAIHFSQIKNIKLTDYKKVIFHRPQYSFALHKIIKQLKRNNIVHLIDFDDLLFCPELSDTSAAVQSGKMSAALAKKHAKRYLKALQLFDHCQVSTDALAIELAKKHTHKITISYNKIPERWIKQAELILAEQRLEKKIIRYLPGTSHHKHDFAHIEKFLAELLYANPSYQLNIIGDLEFDLNAFPKEQISQTPFQPFEQLPSLINDSWIILAPLDDNIFNRCKSGLKFWESGVFGSPVISSPLKDMHRFENKGLCISDNIEDWKAFIHNMENLVTYKTASEQVIEKSQQAFFAQPHLSNCRYTYLKLTSEFGPRWPGDILNPTAPGNKKILETHKAIIQSNQNEPMLLSRVNKSIENDVPARKHKVVQKFKKLISSPKSFFKDSKYFNFILPKH